MLSKSVMKEHLPKFIEENLDYFREEREGCFTFLSKQHPETQQLVLNRTGVEVKELCNGTNTLKDIFTRFKARYPEVPSNILEEEIGNIVRGLWKLGLIEWIGSNPFKKLYVQHLGKNREAYVATEEDVEIIYSFLQIFGIPKPYADVETKKPFYINPAFPLDGYSEVVMRQKMFFNTEGFFLLCENEIVKALISLTFPNALLPDRTTMFGLMLCADTQEPDVSLSRLIDFSIAALQKITPQRIRCSKLKCLHLQETGKKANNVVCDFLSSKRFRQEAIFRDELGWGKDLLILSRRMY